MVLFYLSVCLFIRYACFLGQTFSSDVNIVDYENDLEPYSGPGLNGMMIHKHILLLSFLKKGKEYGN